MVYSIQKTEAQKKAEVEKKEKIELGELLTVFDQEQHFEDCIFVNESAEVFHVDHGLMKHSVFKVIYGGHEFAMGTISKKTTRDAYEAFTLRTGQKTPRVDRAGFNPNKAPGEIYWQEGISFVNVYKPTEVESIAGDVSRFLIHLAKIVPDERDRCYLLGWMAAVVQNPGSKFRWMPVIQGIDGNGKSMLINIMQRAVGHQYSFILPAKKLDDKNNGFMGESLFVGIHEIYVSHRRELVDTLKEWIADTAISSEDKYIKKGMIYNYVNFMACTNHKDAIPKSRNDRRYFVLFTPQQSKGDLQKWGMDSHYFTDMFTWLENGGYGNITNYLQTMQIHDDFHPGVNVTRAPMSSMEAEVVAESKTELQRRISDYIEDAPQGLIGNIISGRKVSEMVGEKYSGVAVTNALKELDWIKHPNLPRGKATRRIFEEEGKRPYLFVKQGAPEEQLDAEAVMQSFMVAQNYGIPQN